MSYTLHELTVDPQNHGAARKAEQIKYLVIHYTGNDGDTARANAEYYHNTVVKASAHYFVDDTEVWRSVPELTIAWAVGGKKWADCAKTGGGRLYGSVNNHNSISVELCDTRRDGVYGASEETLKNAVDLCREIMERYKIPIERVVRHFDVTGKHCPAYMMDEGEWNRFKARLAGKRFDNTPSPAHRDGVEWAVNRGILRGNAEGDMMLHDPVVREQLCTILHRALGGGA